MKTVRSLRAARSVPALAAVAMLMLVAAPPASADGDPASDVLAQQSLFLPQDAGLSPRRQAELAGLVQEASRSGYPIKVAVVASVTDLGSVTALWNQPQLYARFLGQELSLVYRGPLVVVMPTGIGLSVLDTKRATTGNRALAGLRRSAQTDLGPAAAAAIRRLAATAGINLATPVASGRGHPAATDGAGWLAFAIGAVLIVVTWTLSLRARPPARWRADAQALGPRASR